MPRAQGLGMLKSMQTQVQRYLRRCLQYLSFASPSHLMSTMCFGNCEWLITLRYCGMMGSN